MHLDRHGPVCIPAKSLGLELPIVPVRPRDDDLRPRRWSRLSSPRGWFYPALAIAVLVGLSRVAVGVHYPSDVIGGAILGVLGAYATRALFARRGWMFVTDRPDGGIRLPGPWPSLKRYRGAQAARYRASAADKIGLEVVERLRARCAGAASGRARPSAWRCGPFRGEWAGTGSRSRPTTSPCRRARSRRPWPPAPRGALGSSRIENTLPAPLKSRAKIAWSGWLGRAGWITLRTPGWSVEPVRHLDRAGAVAPSCGSPGFEDRAPRESNRRARRRGQAADAYPSAA